MGSLEVTKKQELWKSVDIEPGMVFRYMQASKWKNLSINVFCKIPVMVDKITSLALVPRLATRGTANLPTLQSVSRHLEDMYGAGMGADARKVGPVQVIGFGIDIPSPAYLNADVFGKSDAGPLLISKATSLIWDVVCCPNVVDGGYPENVFEIERNEHRRDIIGIINNRPHYATVRLFQEISRGDPRGLPAWGRLSDLETVGPKTTWQIWKEILSKCPVSIYAIGDGAEEVGEFLSNHKLEFPSARSKQILDIGKELEPPPLPKEVLRVQDSIPGEQTVLCMAFHTGIHEGDPELPAMLLCDGILGGFPHSKLFSVVREQQSLAYFADTVPNTWRGLILAIAGISDEDRPKVEGLIIDQVDAIRKGKISDREMESTRMGLVRRLRTQSDSQAALVRRSLNREILGGVATQEQLVDAILKVGKQDVIDIASRMKLKAVYALRAKGDDTVE